MNTKHWLVITLLHTAPMYNKAIVRLTHPKGEESTFPTPSFSPLFSLLPSPHPVLLEFSFIFHLGAALLRWLEMAERDWKQMDEGQENRVSTYWLRYIYYKTAIHAINKFFWFHPYVYQGNEISLMKELCLTMHQCVPTTDARKTSNSYNFILLPRVCFLPSVIVNKKYLS